MVTKIESQDLLYCERNQDNDLSLGQIKGKPSWMNYAERSAYAFIPVFKLYKPLQLPLNVAQDSLRVWSTSTKFSQNKTTYNALQVAISITALASTVFSHPAGTVITSMQDTLFELKYLIDNIQKGNNQEALKNAIKIMNSALYLTFLCKGGLELSIACLTLKAITLVISFLEKFDKKEDIEGCAHLVMACVRLQEAYIQYIEYQFTF